MRKNQTFPLFGVGFAVYGTCLGRDYREGKHENFGDTCNKAIRCGCLVFDVEVDDGDPARCGTLSVAGGLKAPGGGHRRLPKFG